jgi:hypothetical protein
MSVRKVFLIGTNHRYQMLGELFTVTQSQREESIPMLRDLLKRNEIRAIAEEMNKESLRKHFCRDESFACQVADALGIGHRYCDPDTATGEALSIPRGKEGNPGKERYWLEQLQTFHRFPALFIMGADHFESFRNLLMQSVFKPLKSFATGCRLTSWEMTT